MKSGFAFFSILLLIIGCNKENSNVLNPSDYNVFLDLKQNNAIDFAQKEINFWEHKFNNAPSQTSYLNNIASNYTILFEQTGDVEKLYQAEKKLLQACKMLNYSDATTLRSLARNYITQHRFKEALQLAQQALHTKSKINETNKLLFDVHMELGNYENAYENLKQIYNMNDFDYLIRLAKWSDYKGNLDTAISMMEKATAIVQKNDNKKIMAWSFSNLGDMYGHAGKINTAYEYYLKALQIEPNNYYSLKGLAWIAFSHEKNGKEANRIINAIAKRHESPDFYLLKAEIAEFEKDYILQKKYLTDYFRMLAKVDYGVMYNSYNALLFSEEKHTISNAFSIANQEISNRPTPQSYDLLAWAYFKKGYTKKALEIAQQHIAHQTFEPEILYHLASIYKANNLLKETNSIKKELQSSIFELGPNMNSKIQFL